MKGTTLVLRRLDATAPGFDRELAALTAFESAQDAEVDATVARIVADVRARGDTALLEYTAEFDRVAASSVAALEICRRPRARRCRRRHSASAPTTSARSSRRGRIRTVTAANSASA
jgi:histidinol dehydrogenase